MLKEKRLSKLQRLAVEQNLQRNEKVLFDIDVTRR
ncbi:hypothetical protein L903_18620 [Agrobacterium sp. JL28]|nr:hypothetical protein L902_01805 [Agrobacterium radiobacter DSM 30147]KVK49888.1 hypothetical protein L903_18620 [Agrobacterium sp. JL28]KVK50179.1 hypothetical protein L904_18615 [Agrobacterium sp. LY4]